MCRISSQAQMSVAMSTQPNHCQSNSFGFPLLDIQSMSIYFTIFFRGGYICYVLFTPSVVVWMFTKSLWLLPLPLLRAIRGQKTDMKDATWIADLFKFGIVPSSFIPPKNIRMQLP